MKYLGEGSLSSTTNNVLKFMWGLAIAYIVIVAGISIFLMITNPDPAHTALQIKTQGMTLTFREPAIPNFNSRLLAAPMGMSIPLIAAVLYIIYQLRAIFGTFTRNDPFHPANHIRIRKVGVAIIVVSVITSFAAFLVGISFDSQVGVKGLTITPRLSPDLYTVFLGIIVMILGEVFRVGAEIKKDNDLTV